MQSSWQLSKQMQMESSWHWSAATDDSSMRSGYKAELYCWQPFHPSKQRQLSGVNSWSRRLQRRALASEQTAAEAEQLVFEQTATETEQSS
jgi:hypothetical protein